MCCVGDSVVNRLTRKRVRAKGRARDKRKPMKRRRVAWRDAPWCRDSCFWKPATAGSLYGREGDACRARQRGSAKAPQGTVCVLLYGRPAASHSSTSR